MPSDITENQNFKTYFFPVRQMDALKKVSALMMHTTNMASSYVCELFIPLVLNIIVL